MKTSLPTLLLILLTTGCAEMKEILEAPVPQDAVTAEIDAQIPHGTNRIVVHSAMPADELRDGPV